MSFVEFTGRARLDKRTKHLVRRLSADDIAIVDHSDLDRVSAEELVESGVRVVVNVAESQTGRFPNPGPLLLVRGGVRLIDAPGADLFDTVSEGESLTVRGAGLYRNGACIATGRVRTEDDLARALADQQTRVTESLEAFAENTLRHLREEGSLLSGELDFPPLATRFRDRHALVVARGPGHRRDLRIVRPYVRDFKPVLVGVDGGADALIEAGYKPDMIIGDMDSCSDETLRCGAELVVHAYHDGRAPGLERITALGLQAVVFPAMGTSEDAAMLLADSKGARLLVAVGTHGSLVEFLDKGRAGMASTFITRLRVGPKLVDAKGVSRIYRSQIRTWHLVLLVLSGVLALFTALLFTDVGSAMGSVLVARIRDLLYWVAGLFI
jgi:uncharacterized membrane-anchored protein